MKIINGFLIITENDEARTNQKKRINNNIFVRKKQLIAIHFSRKIATAFYFSDSKVLLLTKDGLDG